MPVLLFFVAGCGTVTADNDRAAEEQATPALAFQKHTILVSSAAPPESVNLFVAETSISSVYYKRKLGEAL